MTGMTTETEISFRSDWCLTKMDLHVFNTDLNNFVRNCQNNVLGVLRGEVEAGHEENNLV